MNSAGLTTWHATSHTNSGNIYPSWQIKRENSCLTPPSVSRACSGKPLRTGGSPEELVALNSLFAALCPALLLGRSSRSASPLCTPEGGRFVPVAKALGIPSQHIVWQVPPKKGHATKLGRGIGEHTPCLYVFFPQGCATSCPVSLWGWACAFRRSACQLRVSERLPLSCAASPPCFPLPLVPSAQLALVHGQGSACNIFSNLACPHALTCPALGLRGACCEVVGCAGCTQPLAVWQAKCDKIRSLKNLLCVAVWKFFTHCCKGRA